MPDRLTLPGGRRIAAPSWVYPASLPENCEFLSGRVDEVGLLFFQAEACLAYTDEDLPPRLADLPLSWHVHLPTDLDWSKPEQAAEICLRLMDRTAFLNTRLGVLHPPLPPDSHPGLFPALHLGQHPDQHAGQYSVQHSGRHPDQQPALHPAQPDLRDLPGKSGLAGLGKQPAVAGCPSAKGNSGLDFTLRCLEIFLERWEKAGRERRDILLENQPEQELEHTHTAAAQANCSICFDLAHFLLHNEKKVSCVTNCGKKSDKKMPSGAEIGQKRVKATENTVFDPRFLERVRMLHLCAPSPPREDGSRSGHAPLTALRDENNDEHALSAALEEANRGNHAPKTALQDGLNNPASQDGDEPETALDFAVRLCRSVAPDTVFMLELFKWEHIERSYPLLRSWLADC